MLEPQEKSQEEGHLVVQAEEGCRSALFLHEWQIWFEKKCIVVFANKTLSALVSSDQRRDSENHTWWSQPSQCASSCLPNCA